MTAQRLPLALGLIVGAVLVSACEVESQPPPPSKRLISQSTAYANPESQRVFKLALKDAGIPYDIYTGDGGLEYVRWKGEDSAKVEAIQARLFGEPLPDGRHIHFGPPDHERFKTWLTANGIPFSTRQSRGKEYVIWQESDYPKVSQWEHFPRDTYNRMARGLSSNTTPHTDARDVPAPAEAPGARAGGRER